MLLLKPKPEPNLHVLDGRLIAVVDHLLEPQALMQDPDNNQAPLVARRELRVRCVPGYAYLEAIGG